MNPQHQQKRKICQSCRLKLYLRPSFIAFFNFSHKRPTFAFTVESGYTLAFANRIAHNGTHSETGGVSDGGAIITLDTSCTFTNIPGPGVRTANFAPFGSWPRVLPKASRPRWAARLFYFCLNCGLYALRSGPFRVCETRGGITTLGVLCVLLKRWTAACQKG